MDTETIKKMLLDSARLQKEITDALAFTYPKGTKIRCFLNRNQRKPSIMIVIGHSGNGKIRAYMESDKSRTGRFVRDIDIKYIC